MEKDRRAGLTIKEQKDMYQKINKLHTILLGNGVKGKLQEFEEKDEELEIKIGGIQKTVWKSIGAASILLPVLTALIIYSIQKLL